MKCNVTRQTAIWLQQADLILIICRSYFDLISGYSRPILGRSYADHISILFRVTAGRFEADDMPILFWPYFRLQQANLRPITFRTYFGLQQADLRPIIFRSYFGLQQADVILGYSRPILFTHSAKRVRDAGKTTIGCRQNKLRFLWNALLTTPYLK